MKRIIYLLSLVLLAVNAAWADDISVEQALQIASRFSAIPTQGGAARAKSAKATTVEPRLAHAVKSKTSQKDNVYVINLGDNQGFVIVAGDDGADAFVLGYCDHGTFEYDKAPIQLQDLLGMYAADVDSLRASGATKNIISSPKNATGNRDIRHMILGDIIVEPMITTKWSQWTPYNNLCPTGCPTGCVPTALAQIMNYWKHPEVTRGRLRDTHEDFSGHTYDWGNMLPQYEDGKYTDEQATAVAKLMADIGEACRTIYTPTESGTTIENLNHWPLASNFRYSPQSKFYSAGSAEALIGLMKDELNMSRPILYDAMPIEGEGHALVIDGYTRNNYFHFNYGWGGDSDGWYKNAVCNTFNVGPRILVGLCPYNAVEIIQDNLRYELLPDGTANVAEYLGDSNGAMDLAIPNTVTDGEGREYKVTRILKTLIDRPFAHFTRLQIGDNVKEIATTLFNNCSIDKLIFCDGAEVISANVFPGAKIGELVIGSGMKRIEERAFVAGSIQKITSSSPAIAVGDLAFGYCKIPDGEWLGCLTELGAAAFRNVSFSNTPSFSNLEKIGALCFAQTSGLYGEFLISDKVKEIDPEAFHESQLTSIRVDGNNPYYSWPNFAVVCNKSETSLSLVFNRAGVNLTEDWIPSTVLKFEPRSIPTRSGYSVTIPRTVEDVTGAFSSCEALKSLICLAVVPPTADDNTFNDALVNNPDLTLYVPIGTEELYEIAPGWRRFKNIVGNKPYVRAPLQADREYYMVLHCTGADGEIMSKRIPTSKVKDIRVGDYIAEEGQTIIVTEEGKENAYRVDEITFMKGFVYGEAEVFDIAPDAPVVKASSCTVTFGGAAVTKPIQVSIKQPITVPPLVENVKQCVAVDINLSTDEHQLNGIAEITIPMPRGNNDQLLAAYYNMDMGEWEPVLAIYNEEKQEATIITDHLSMFMVLSTEKDGTSLAYQKSYDNFLLYDAYDTFNGAVAKMFNLVTSDDPDAYAFQKAREDVGTWQTLGIDCLLSAASGLGCTAEALDNAVSAIGWLTTATTFLDTAVADIKGDNTAVAATSLKTLMGVLQGYNGILFNGVSAMSLSMAGVALIGLGLDKFGSYVQQAKKDYVRAIYRYYYSPEGVTDCSGLSSFGTNYYREKWNWYELFMPAFKEGKVKEIDAYIEQVVRRYCDRFWEENEDVINICKSTASLAGFTPVLYINEDMKQAVCDEYFVELMQGPVAEAISDIRKNLAANTQFKDYMKAVRNYQSFVNTGLALSFKDSSRPADDYSKYKGWTVRFTNIPATITDPEKFEGTIDENGNCELGWFTYYALITNQIKTQVALFDKKGTEQAVYDFQLPSAEKKVILSIDLAKEGKEVTILNDLSLEYEPESFDLTMGIDYTWTNKDIFWGDKTYKDSVDKWREEYVRYDTNVIWQPDLGNTPKHNVDSLRNTHFQTEIEKFFRKHDSITFEFGKVKIGNDIVGDWNEATQEGSGKFTIKTDYSFVEQTRADFVAKWNSLQYDNPLLEGTMSHDIDCTFNVKHLDDEEGYEITFTGEGSFHMYAEKVVRLQNLNADPVIEQLSDLVITIHLEFCQIGTENLFIRYVTDDGKVKLNYTKKL